MGSDLCGVWLTLCLLELVEKNHGTLATGRVVFSLQTRTRTALAQGALMAE